MKAEELMKPRFEVIADYPSNQNPIGTVLECPNYDHDFTKKYWIESNEKYPHLFRKLNWWEHRKVEDMPQKVKAVGFDDVYEIEEWDMSLMIGWVDKKERQCCYLRLFNPEYGYFPID